MIDNIAGILLAAGNSSRYGDNKLLQQLPHSQSPVVVESAKNLLDALPNSVAVIKKNDTALKSLLPSNRLQICENPYSDEGIASSIRVAIREIQKWKTEKPDIKGYVIALADMPFIPADIIKAVAVELMNGQLICAPRYNGQRGHPVGFSSSLSKDLLKLEGDNGAKIIINNHQDKVLYLDVKTDGILTDIDYPSDLNR